MENKPEQQPKLKPGSTFWEVVRYAILALVIIIPFRIFIAQPYIVEGSSSDPTFKNGDYLIVEQLSKRWREPERQDFLIVKCPNDTSKSCIKRLIGLPGEVLNIKEGKVYIGENLLAEPYVKYSKVENMQVELESDQYFVMGDNRAGSADSRMFGPIPKSSIVGRPLIRLFPLNKIGTWPGME